MIPKPRTMLLYGKSGVGKTSNLKMLAKWFYDRYKLKVRLITSDGGGYEQFNDSDNLIGKGIVEVFDNTDRELALQDCNRLGDGCWPVDGGELERDMNITNKPYRAKKFEKEEIGAYFVEGIESLGDALKSHFADQLTTKGKDQLGFEPPWTYEEGDYAVAGIQPGHFGILQTELNKLIVKKFAQLPIKLLVFTSKELLGLEVTSRTKKSGEKFSVSTGEPLYGPSSIGIALTSKIPGWFANCLHMERVLAQDKEGKSKEVRVAWFQTHNRVIEVDGSPTSVPCLAKSSCPAERYESMMEYFKGPFVQLGFKRGVDRYVEFLEGLENK